ncbi:MAG: histidine phosphatase family protein [Lachnospiraceae bacterium]|nr:histidine phosphatase family protein [Lachnospiraceae bacterium]
MNNTIECLLVRHGLTKGNEEKRYIGNRSDEGLSVAGKEQCKKLSEALRKHTAGKKSLLISGELKRCVTSAKLLFPDIPAVTDKDISEIDFGDFEGKNHLELKDNTDYMAWLASGGTSSFPGGESREDFIKRSFDTFARNIKRFAGDYEQIVFVCHGGNIMSVMSSLTGKNYFDFQVSCCEGYKLTMEVTDEGIDLVSYSSLLYRDSA